MILKDCPFCGAKSDPTDCRFSDILIDLDNCDHFYVYCENCGCRTNGQETKERAIKLWNTRVKE